MFRLNLMVILLLSSLIHESKSTYAKVPKVKVLRVGTSKLVLVLMLVIIKEAHLCIQKLSNYLLYRHRFSYG